MAVLCFDQHEHIPAPKQVEMRARDTRVKAEEERPHTDRVVDDVLPSPWNLVMKHRDVREAVCEYIRAKISERFYLPDVPPHFSMILYGAGGQPSLFYEKTHTDHGVPVLIPEERLMPKIGESDISMVALRQYFYETEQRSTVVISTVDTDLIAILLLQEDSNRKNKQEDTGKTIVDLYYNQKGGIRNSTVLNIDSLWVEIQASVNIPMEDYVMTIMLQVRTPFARALSIILYR